MVDPGRELLLCRERSGNLKADKGTKHFSSGLHAITLAEMSLNNCGESGKSFFFLFFRKISLNLLLLSYFIITNKK